jgi:hypothetical protein
MSVNYSYDFRKNKFSTDISTTLGNVAIKGNDLANSL